MKSFFKYTIILIIASIVSCTAYTKQQTYTNKKYGFSISYPDNLKLSSFGKSYLLPNYWSTIAETRSTKTKSIVSIPIISFNLDKNLSTVKPGSYYYAAVRVGISSKPKDVQKCYKPYPFYNPKKVLINGVTFHKLNIEAAGMNQYLSGQSYRIKQHHLCYALEFITTGSNPQSKDEDKKLQRFKVKAEQLATQIIKSFRFCK